LCTKGVDLEELNNYPYDYFTFQLNIFFDRCDDGDKNCVYDRGFNEYLINNATYINLHYIAAGLDLNNYANPFFDYVATRHDIGYQSIRVDLSLNQVKTKNWNLFDSEFGDAKFKLKIQEPFNFRGSFMDFSLNYAYNTVNVYERHYRTFSSALASTLSIQIGFILL
jgi:hypothetical protein